MASVYLLPLVATQRSNVQPHDFLLFLFLFRLLAPKSSKTNLSPLCWSVRLPVGCGFYSEPSEPLSLWPKDLACNAKQILVMPQYHGYKL